MGEFVASVGRELSAFVADGVASPHTLRREGGEAVSTTSGLGGAEGEQRTVRISQHDTFHGRIERRVAEDAGRDTQPLVEIDNAVADRRFVRKCRRCGVDDGL